MWTREPTNPETTAATAAARARGPVVQLLQRYRLLGGENLGPCSFGPVGRGSQAERGARAVAAVTPGAPKLIKKAEASWLAEVPAVVGCSDRAGLALGEI